MILRTNSVVNPTAMINNHVQIHSRPDLQVNPLAQKLEANKGYLGNYFYLFLLLEQSGARFSEVQEVKHTDIALNGSILIHGKKRSFDRVVRDDRCTAWLLKCKAKEVDPFHGCNIWTANRMLKSIGVVKQKKGRKRLTVSGVFRDSYAAHIRTIQKDERTLTRSIGHKAQANDNYYGRD